MKHKFFDSILPYTYLIVNKSNGLLYHGVRYVNVKNNRTPNEDLGFYYFGSSSVFKISKESKNDYIFKLKNTFDTIEEAIAYEGKINKKLIRRDAFVNKSAYPCFILSEESKAKISKSNKGRVCSPESRAKISQHNKGLKRTSSQKETYSKAIKKGFIEGSRKIWNKDKRGIFAPDVLTRMSESKIGSKNPQFGMPAYQGNAFTGLKGVKNGRFGKITINNKTIQILIKGEELDDYILKGWLKGGLPGGCRKNKFTKL